jgi:primase-polymerase (primpol)-like protein
MPETWTGYERAKAYAERYRYTGLVFALDKGIVFIDLDRAIDPATGEITSPEARRLLELLPDTYTETSVGGAGIHILLKGGLPPDAYRRNDGKGIEMYDTRRFVCMTGDVTNGSGEIKDYSDRIGQIAYDFVGRRPPAHEYAVIPATQSDTELIARISGSKQGAKFQALYRGDMFGYPSHSHADSAFVFVLAWWVRDPAQIDRIFRSSGLMREKWDSRRGGGTYGGQLIDEALSTVIPRRGYVPQRKIQQAEL